MPRDNRDRIIRGRLPPPDEWHRTTIPDVYIVHGLLDEMWDWAEENTVDSFI